MSIVNVPLTVTDGELEEEYILYGGFIQNLWDEERKGICPSLDYAIIYDRNSRFHKKLKCSRKMYNEQYI